MKSFQPLLIACMAGSFLFAACTKENGYLSPYNPGGSSDSTTNKGGGSSTGGTADSTYNGTVTNNYQPNSAGSQWTYTVNQVFNIANSTIAKADPAEATLFAGSATNTTTTYHVQALGTTSSVGALTYNNFSNDYSGGIFSPGVTVTGSGGTTYQGVDVVWEVVWSGGSSFTGFSLNNDTLVYLEDQPAGTSWSQTTVQTDAFGISDTNSYTFTIKATGLTKTENQIGYPNVIQVESKTTPSAFASYAALFAAQGIDLSTTTEYYFAKNVGLIEEDLSEPFMGITLTAQLTSATIK